MAASRNITYLRRWEFVKGKEPMFDALKENFEELLKALNLSDVHMWADEEKLVFRGTGPYMPVAVWLGTADGKPVVEMAVSGKGEQIRAQDLEKYFVRSIGAVDRFLASMDRAELFRQKYLTKGTAFGVGAVAGAAVSKAVVGSVKLVAKGVRALLRDQEAYDKELAFYLRAMGIGDLVVGGKDSGNLTPVLKEQAEHENVLAQYQLGVSYASGVGAAADEDEAIRWFERAASHGELRSKNIVAGAWLYGDKDYPVEKKLLGVQYLVDLAASGETWAPAQIIDIYKDGAVSGIPADYDKMVEYAAMYAQQGYLYAAHVLAEVCDTARGPEVSRPYKDDAQAALLYNMILENEKCDYTETAAMCLADMYRTGRGVAENVEQAIACYRQASSYGNMEAKIALLELFSQTLENEESRTEIRTLARQLKGSGSAPLSAAAVYFLYRVEDAEEQYGKAMKLAQQYVADPCAEAQKTEETKAYLAKMEERISQMSEEERRLFLKERKKLFDSPAATTTKGLIFGFAAIAIIVLALCFAQLNPENNGDKAVDSAETWETMDDSYTVDVYGEMILVRDTNDDCVNLREGPGTEYDVITELPNGTWVNLATGMQDDRWTCLILSDGRMGWVYSEFVHDLRGVIRNNSNTGCNVRQGPGTDYDIIGYLYNGEYATAYDACDDDGWYCIEYEGGVGWISGGFWHDGGLYVYNTNYDGANFRAEPSEESEILAYITNYETVIPVDGVDEGEWVHVQYAGMTGWVYRDFICYSGRRENDTEVVQASSQLTSAGSRSDADLTDYEVEYIQTILAALGKGNEVLDVSAVSDVDIVHYTSNLVDISCGWLGTINILDWETVYSYGSQLPLYEIEKGSVERVAQLVFERTIGDEELKKTSDTYGVSGQYHVGISGDYYCIYPPESDPPGCYGIELLKAEEDKQYLYVDYTTYFDYTYTGTEPTEVEMMSAVLSRNDDEEFPFRLVSACSADVSGEEPDEYLGEKVSVFDEVYWHFSIAGKDYDMYDATYVVCLYDDGTYVGFALLGSGPNVGDIMGGNLIAGQYYFDSGSLYDQDVECQYLQDENVFFAELEDCYWVWQPDVDGTYRAEFEQYEQAREAFLN